MKHPFRCQILPYFTMGAGGIGLALRLWLFSAVDEKGLLPAKHPAGSALFLLSALVLGILFLATRQPEVRPFRKNSLRLLNTAAYVLGGIGLILNAAVVLPASSAKLALPAMGLCLFGGLVMLFMAFLTFRNKPLAYWLPGILTLVLMIDTVAQCQVWGAEPQLQVYFFPLMASVLLILTAYQKTALLAGKGKRTLLAFFSQAAAFFCCLSGNSQQKLLYISMFLWAILQLFPVPRVKKEAQE
jgi:hypothetical protein